MQRTVAFKERGRLTLLLNSLLHKASRAPHSPKVDRRNLSTLRQLTFGVLLKRTTRLLALAQTAVLQRQANTVKSAAMALSYFLNKAEFPTEAFFGRLSGAALNELEPDRLATYRGKAVLVIDTTDYPKRSRGKGKVGRHMQPGGRVRKTHERSAKARAPTTSGYVDIWAGLVLKGKQFFPLVRRLLAS
jgi:hypothetical protein